MLARSVKRKYLQAAIAILSGIGLLYLFHSISLSDSQNAAYRLGNSAAAGKQGFGESDSSILTRLDIKDHFEFQRYCMKTRQKDGLSRQKQTTISPKSAVASRVLLESSLLVGEKLPSCTTHIDVDVPKFDISNAKGTEMLVLGVATKLSRLDDSLSQMQRWLSHTWTQLVVLVVDKPDLSVEQDTVNRLYSKAAALKIDMVLHPYSSPGDSEGLKNFGLAGPLTEEVQRRRETRWVGIIDDDTFFVSLPQIIERLNQYDHGAPLYIGQLSEGFTRVSTEGFKAWGGGGIFLSVPLLNEIASHAEDCKPLDTGFGDILWRDCIYKVTSPTVKLTQLEGLNQMDFWRDPSGWYEAGNNPIFTVHHWKSWHFHPIPAAHLVVDVAGPDSFLQRYLFDDASSVLTNGYSFVHYPNGVPDLNLVELTMVEDVGKDQMPAWKEFHTSMGRTRTALSADEKKSWIFSHASPDNHGNIRQFYLRKDIDGNGTASLIEVDWIA